MTLQSSPIRETCESNNILLQAKKLTQTLTGEKVKKGYEHIKGFTLGGFLPPLEITPEDHEGGGWVRVYQWNGEKFVLAKDWYKAHGDIIAARLAEVAK